jgi:hypothetical protein
MRGTPPLPGGRVVSLLDPKHFTAAERGQLQKIGWTEDQPVPSTLGKIIQDVQSEAAKDIAAGQTRYAVDPSTPPVQFKPVPLEQLTPEQQAKIRRLMSEAVAQAAADTAAEQMAMNAPPALSEAAQTIQQAKTYDLDPLPIDRPAPANSVEPLFDAPLNRPIIEQVAPPAAAAPLEDLEPSAGTPAAGQTVLSHCPHCNWDLMAVDIPEPDEPDRAAFAEAVAGATVFTKDYAIMGGRVKMWFRELTTPEIDMIFRQVFHEREDKRLTTELDVWERINRLRLCLQLQRLTTDRD